MSALTSRTAAITRRLATTTTTTSTLSRAAFTTTTRYQKTPVVDAAKDTLKSVDRKVSDKLVDGINIGSTSPAPTPPHPTQLKKPILTICSQQPPTPTRSKKPPPKCPKAK